MNLAIKWILNASALIITSDIVPGFHVNGYATALIAALVLGIINTIIKPILIFLTLPLTIITLGLFTFVINAVVLWLASQIVPGIFIDSALSAILAALVLSVVSTILTAVFQDLRRNSKR